MKSTIKILFCIALFAYLYYCFKAYILWREDYSYYAWTLWLILLIIWQKSTSFLVFLFTQGFTNKSNINTVFWESIKERILSNCIDAFFIFIIWLILTNILSVPIFVLNNFFFENLYALELEFNHAWNLVLDYSLFTLPFTFLFYNIFMEYKWGSTLGKLFFDLKIVTLNNTKPRIQNIVLKNCLRFLLINDIWIYLKSYSLNEYLSKIRIVKTI